MVINRRYHTIYDLKRVRRLRIRLGLKSFIRCSNGYSTKTSFVNIEENILNREFTADNSNEKWVTVITHLQYGFVGITRSMSRVGNCIDNAPIESFFGHVKCESYDLKHYKTYEELTEAIDQYIKFYNKERYQEKLNSLAPLEYRYQAIA